MSHFDLLRRSVSSTLVLAARRWRRTSHGALAHFDGVVLNALRETQSSLATYAGNTTRADALRTAYRSAVESADETHRLFSAGRKSFVADLDATRTLTGVAAQVAAADAQVTQDQVNLFLALGGGWEHDDADAEPLADSKRK